MDKYKVIIAGGRDFNDFELLENGVNAILSNIEFQDVEIVSGGARGADSLGEQYAKKYGFDLKVFPADWDSYGKMAGHIRNREMAEYADCLIAFWDNKSRGTKNMIELANQHGLDVYVIKY